MDIKKFLKPGKNMVIGIDEVEYLVDDKAVAAIERGDERIDLIQLFDRQYYTFDIKTIQNSLSENGVIDYLDKRN